MGQFFSQRSADPARFEEPFRRVHVDHCARVDSNDGQYRDRTVDEADVFILRIGERAKAFSRTRIDQIEWEGRRGGQIHLPLGR
jgi:hypothetical protein